MGKTRIVGDSTCDLSQPIKERLGIGQIPLYVNLDGKSYRDGVDITPDDIYAYVERTHEIPKTAAPSVQDYIDAFSPWVEAGEDVVYLPISSQMSSSMQNARIAAESFGAGRVRVVDSKNLSTGIGLLVMMAAEMAQQGASAEDCARAVEGATGRVHASFIVETVRYLYMGGRVNALTMMGASALRIHPKIVVTDGQMHPAQKYRGSMERAMEAYCRDELRNLERIDPKRIFITHSGCKPEWLELMQGYIAQHMAFDEVLKTRAGCVITSHCGPNTLGILYMDKA
ncbi:MAG: DegV family protein [Christensenellales bacterium]|jgi:DegV family protein with EDD domain